MINETRFEKLNLSLYECKGRTPKNKLYEKGVMLYISFRLIENKLCANFLASQPLGSYLA